MEEENFDRVPLLERKNKQLRKAVKRLLTHVGPVYGRYNYVSREKELDIKYAERILEGKGGVKLTKKHEGRVIRVKWKPKYNNSTIMMGCLERVTCDGGETCRRLKHGPHKDNWLWMNCFDLSTTEILTPEDSVIWRLENNV